MLTSVLVWSAGRNTANLKSRRPTGHWQSLRQLNWPDATLVRDWQNLATRIRRPIPHNQSNIPFNISKFPSVLFSIFFCISENQVVELYEYNEDLTTTEDSWTNRSCHHSCKLYRCKVGKEQLENLSFVEPNYSWSICWFHSRALAIRGVFVTRWVVRALINREMLLLIKWPSANVKLEIRSEWSAQSRSLKAFII
jgi:hypothetical protein